MEKLILFGISSFAHQIFRYLKDDNRYEVAAFCVEEKYMNGKTEFDGLPVVSFESVTEFYPPSEYKFIVCIGYTQMNKVREIIFEKCLNKGYELPNYIHPTAIVLADTIGIGNIFLEGSCVGGGTEIGNGNIFYAKAHIAHDCKVGNYNFFAISCAIAGDVVVDNNCFIGNNATVKNSLTINDGTLVGAAAYISNNTEPWSVYVPQRSYRLDGKNSLDTRLVGEGGVRYILFIPFHSKARYAA